MDGDRVSGLVPAGPTVSGWAANYPWGGILPPLPKPPRHLSRGSSAPRERSSWCPLIPGAGMGPPACPGPWTGFPQGSASREPNTLCGLTPTGQGSNAGSRRQAVPGNTGSRACAVETTGTRRVFSLCPVFCAEHGLVLTARAAGYCCHGSCLQALPDSTLARVKVLAQGLPSEHCPCRCHCGMPSPRGQPKPCLGTGIAGQNLAEMGLGSSCPAAPLSTGQYHSKASLNLGTKAITKRNNLSTL